MAKQEDFDRLEKIRTYIKENSEELLKDLKSYYEYLEPEELTYIMKDAEIPVFWKDSDNNENILSHFLKDQCPVILGSEQIIKAFIIFNEKLTKRSLKKAFDCFRSVFPEYFEAFLPDVREAENRQNSVNGVPAHEALMGGKYKKVKRMKGIIKILKKRDVPSELCSKKAGFEFCQLHGKVIGLGKAVRDYDKSCLDTFLLLDGLSTLNKLISHINKEDGIHDNMLALSAGIKKFYYDIEIIMFERKIDNPKDIKLDETNEKVKVFLKQSIEDQSLHVYIELIMASISDFEANYILKSMFYNDKYDKSDIDWSFLQNLLEASHWINEIQKALFQNLLDKMEVSCMGTNEIIKLFDKPSIQIISWVKQRRFKFQYQEVC